MEQFETIDSLIRAVQDRSWYPIIGLAFTLLISLLRLINASAWEGLPRWAKPIPAVAMGTIVAFVTAFEAQLTWEQALGVSLYTLVTTTLVSLGLADAVNRLSGSKDKKAQAVKAEAYKAGAEKGITQVPGELDE